MSRHPRRMIPPVLDDPRTRMLTPEQERTFLLLPLAVDDHGRALDDPGTLNGFLWGSRWEEHPPERIDAELASVAELRLVTRYEVDGVRYLQVMDWSDQQVVSRPAPSLYPPPPGGTRTRRGGPGDTMWSAVEGLVGVVAGAAEKLQDPGIQAQGVRLLADLAGQIDPALARRVRERAGGWVATPPPAPPSEPPVSEPPVGEPPVGEPPVSEPPAQPEGPRSSSAWAQETD